MLEFEILYDVTNNPKTLKYIYIYIYIYIYFYLKYIKCKLNAYNIHFGLIYKIEIPKIRPFLNSLC